MRKLAVLLLVATGASAGAAYAHVLDGRTAITIRSSAGGAVSPGARVDITGRLSSNQPACRSRKVVRLFLARTGDDRVLARDVTDADGDYGFVHRPTASGRVYTTFAGSFQSSYGHSHRCRGSRSALLRLAVR